ncbi:MAG: hypothetical protein GF317_05010 [Candidatus Lokiarchaeota archaeon]|nr:hypothetical protein [Candidatus Lokiarchaeota archaeon]MBD3199165.1 hypothetical protein [Candidatus Lokiarchaeota archaeon]
MAKKKQKKEIEEDSLDSALRSTKKTEVDLHSLLSGVKKGKGFYHKELDSEEEQERKAPQLFYNKEETKEPAEETKEEVEEEIVVPEEKSASVKEKPSFVDKNEKADKKTQKDNIYLGLTNFFQELFEGYSERYTYWEESISSLLSILRKMRKITKKNTEELVLSINEAYERVHAGLDQFKVKRDEIEKIAEVDIQSMSSEFRKVLGLLELQVKEYQLKKTTDEFFH